MSFQNEINDNINFYFKNINLEELDVFSQILINNLKNNILILGIGKSFNVGKHLSDLLKCINFKSFMLESSSLLHGDIGLISNKDLVIFISNSGNTNELVEILNIIIRNKIGCQTVLLSSRKGKISHLIKHNFIVPFQKELTTCFSLIPTNSITNFILYSNQLLETIISKMQLHKNVYLKNHNSGSIGDSFRKVKDKMIKLDKCCILQGTETIKKGIIEMNRMKIACIVVMLDEKIYGFITDRDIRNYLENDDNLNDSISKIANKNYYFINDKNTYIKDITKNFNYIPVVENEKIIGIYQQL